MTDEPQVSTYDEGLGCWVPAAPLPYYRPRYGRARTLWRRLRGIRDPWVATETDPNPHERWWRRG